MSKPATTKPAASVETPSPSIRTLKIATCPSLSGASKLTYRIGCADKSGILFSITGNSAAGVFSNEWIALADIQQVFDAIPPGKLIRSALLQPLYQAKSINTPAFLLAALMGAIKGARVELNSPSPLDLSPPRVRKSKPHLPTKEAGFFCSCF